MKIGTKYSNTVEVKEENIIHFSKGLPAFEKETSFVLLPFEHGTPFYVLQSLKTREVAFVVADPFSFVNSYEVKIPDGTIEQLKIMKQDDVAIFVMLTVREPFTETTANLQAPLIINSVQKKGKQLVMSESHYRTKHAIFQSPVTKEER